MSLVNWDNLKEYKTNQNKSFEELCYQLVYEEHSSQGQLTSIDDSGGGDGVEFFLELPNGDVWGWQCKFFGRLSESGRKTQIKKSLQKAYDTHGNNLKKWVLCSQLTFTNEERTWFKDTLPTSINGGRIVLPENNDVALEHFGDSKIINLLRKYPDINRYFFADKVLDLDWFKSKFDLVSNLTIIKTKYLNGLHVSGQADETVIQILSDPRLAEIIGERKKVLEVDRFLIEFDESIASIQKHDFSDEFRKDYLKVSEFLFSNEHPSIIKRGNNILDRVQELLLEEDTKSLSALIDDILTYKQELTEFYTGYSAFRDQEEIPSFHWDAEEEEKDEAIKQKIKKCREIALGPYFTLRNYMDAYLGIFHCLEYRHLNDVHISGGASKGKTHLAANIVEHQISNDKPALFIFGKNFRTNRPLKEQLKELLDLPGDWSVTEFLGALNVSGRLNNTKAVLLIDGLNESIHWKNIWGTNLEMLINEINQNYPNVLLITTYRESYERELFPDDYFYITEDNWQKRTRVDGFTGENLNEAIERYFSHYDIKLLNSSSAMNHFSEPLYLKIFCEAKKGQEVSFQNEDLFDVFDQYLEKSNINVVENLGLPLKYNKKFSQNILSSISRRLWDESGRSVDLSSIMPDLMKEEQLVAFEGEDLLIFRDWGEQEVITFTYDLLNGYLIAKLLVEDISSYTALKQFVSSDKFKKELITRETLHPLYNDILRCFAVLIIKRFGLSIYNEEIDAKLKRYILSSLFEINTEVVIQNSDESIQIVVDSFNDAENKDRVFNLFTNTELDIEHPLNFNLLSDLLLGLSMADRDITWTEYIRKEYGRYSSERLRNFIVNFESACKDQEITSDKIHIAAKKVMWLLTSTNREMRDNATKAIYYYGRRYIAEFIKLIEFSLSVNDPYVWERILGALYGVILAKHNEQTSSDFREKILKELAHRLYELVFAPDAPHGTTHIIARDYARRSIEICLVQHPGLLSEEQITHIKPPYSFGGIRSWGEYDYGEKDYGYDEPIRMDFSNYTIGAIVPDGGSYSDPPEKQKVRRQIYWRIFDLGWDNEKFKKAEKRLSEQSYYNSRTEKAKTERYGKKYSWIAFFEIYGYREDNDLVKEDWPDFRPSESDIDPTFPELPENKPFIEEDFLGDRSIGLVNWLNNSKKPSLKPYLVMKDLNNENEDWVCLDGFISQKDEEHNREQFVFVRGMLIKNEDCSEFLKQLENGDFMHNRIPRISENYYTFAGEMNTLEDATYDNLKEVRFKIDRIKRVVKKDEEGYYPEAVFGENGFRMEYPQQREIEETITNDFEYLAPVAEYNWESHHSSTNQAGHQCVLSKEISFQLNLVNAPQTFDLFEKDGKLATINVRYYEDYHTNQHFLYLRKDLFEKFITGGDYKLIWGIWGEKRLYFKEYGASRDFGLKNKTEVYKVFKEIESY